MINRFLNLVRIVHTSVLFAVHGLFYSQTKKDISFKVRDYNKAISLTVVDVNQRTPMKLVFIVIFFSVMTSLNLSAQAQNDYAKLEKNVNIRAKGLIQNLNKTKDTLILRSNSLINKVYAVSEDYKRELDIVVNNTDVQIPLHNLSKGKHVFVVVQSPMRIVFVVKILRDDHLLLAVKDEDLVAKNEKK